MIKAAEKASKILIRDFGELEKLQVSKKGPNDFVTNSDLKTEKLILKELINARPNYSVLTEEAGLKQNKDKNKIWIIDPIDGTLNFLHGIPHFCISIALQDKNEILSGVIFDPIKDEMFFAEKDQGAFLNNHRIHVSKKNLIEDCLFATDGNHKVQVNINYRKSGSAALDMAYVAAGRYDGHIQKRLNLWDIAAGAIIVKEAGGIVSKLNLKMQKNIDIISCSENIEDTLKKIVI